MAPGRLQQQGSERARLDPFDALAGDVPPRDQRDLMERPFFSLAKAKRTAPILYTAGDTQVQVHGLPEHGIATIWDADVLIWAASHLVEALDRGLPTSRFFRFTPYQLLGAIGRGRGQRDYLLLKGALARLQSTVIRTTIRHGAHWRRQQFSWISEWEELTTWSGRVEGMEFVLPDWFYQGVLDRRLVLTVDPAYFRLTGGLERWLYRVARKHAGRQAGGWRFELRHLHAKSASLARFSDFALDIRRLVARQPLPGYALALRQEAAGAPLLHIRPVDNLWTSAAGHGTSGASDIGTSGAPGTGLRAQESPDPPAGSMRCGSRNFSNSESNLQEVVGPARRGERDRDGERGVAP
jgi:plasmid replication initiation protein